MKSLHPIAISPSGQQRSTRAKNKHHTTLNYIKRFINQHLHRCREEAALMFKAVAVVRLTFQRFNRRTPPKLPSPGPCEGREEQESHALQ